MNVISSQLTAEPQTQLLKMLALISVNTSGILPNVCRVSTLQKLTGHTLICVCVVLCRVGNSVTAPNSASTVNEIISHTLFICVSFAVCLE